MNRLMILGSMYEFVPLVTIARQRGYYTVVCDGYADGPAKQYADKAYNVDIRNVDDVVEICRKENVDGIIASFSDILFEYLVKIAHKAGLKTYCTPENSLWLRSKEKMRQMFRELDIPCPQYRILEKGYTDDNIAGMKFPLVMKPVDGYGSRGVFVVQNKDELRNKFDETSRFSIGSDSIMTEEYNDGYEFNMMNWVVDGEVHTLSFADREKSVEIQGDIPHITRLVYPSRMTDVVYKDAKSIVQKVADYVGIQNGPLCMQFFYRPGQGIQACECAGRIFGYEHELLTYSSGFSIEDLLLDYVYDEASMKKNVKAHSVHLPKISCGLYFHGHEGVVAGIEAAQEEIVKMHPLEYRIYYKNGDVISHAVGAMPYVIQVDLAAESYEELDEKCIQLISKLSVKDPSGKELLYRSDIIKGNC